MSLRVGLVTGHTSCRELGIYGFSGLAGFRPGQILYLSDVGLISELLDASRTIVETKPLKLPVGKLWFLSFNFIDECQVWPVVVL